MTSSRAIALNLVVLTATSLGWLGCNRAHTSPGCKERRDAMDAKVAQIKRDAREQLKIGTKQGDLMLFFSKNGFPFGVVGSVATGDIYFEGCAPPSCESDKALIGLRVDTAPDGSVRSEPEVVTRYTSCY